MTAVSWTTAATPQPLWRLLAACGPEHDALFFGRDGEHEGEREAREDKAKAICAGCPARSACLDFALTLPEPEGIWAGCNADELLKVRRNRWHNARRLRARERKAAA